MNKSYYIDRVHKQIIYTDQEFQHHGVEGQRWGVITRNVGVNYVPIGRGGGSKQSSNSRKTNEKMTAKQWLKYRYAQDFEYAGREDLSRRIHGSNNGENRKVNKWSEEGLDRSHILTEDAKKNQMFNRKFMTGVNVVGLGLNIGVSAAFGVSPNNIIIGAYHAGMLAARVYDNKLHKEGIAKDNDRRADLPVDKKTGFHLRTDNDEARVDLDRVNPGKRFLMGDANCPGCAIATELRQRGYDVRAKDFDGISATQSLLNGFKGGNRKVADIYKQDVGTTSYKLSKIGENPDCTTATMKFLSSQPEGSRGFLFMSYGRGGGHVTNYFIENGKAKIYEGQLGRRLGPSEYGPLLRSCYYTSFCRVDDLPINAEICKEVIE